MTAFVTVTISTSRYKQTTYLSCDMYCRTDINYQRCDLFCVDLRIHRHEKKWEMCCCNLRSLQNSLRCGYFLENSPSIFSVLYLRSLLITRGVKEIFSPRYFFAADSTVCLVRYPICPLDIWANVFFELRELQIVESNDTCSKQRCCSPLQGGHLSALLSFVCWITPWPDCPCRTPKNSRLNI